MEGEMSLMKAMLFMPSSPTESGPKRGWMLITLFLNEDHNRWFEGKAWKRPDIHVHHCRPYRCRDRHYVGYDLQLDGQQVVPIGGHGNYVGVREQ